MPREPHELSLTQIASELRARRISCRELTQSYLDRLSVLDPRIQAFITVAGDLALSEADLIDRQIAAREALAPLAGIPIAVKDSIPTRGIRTTANSRLLEGWIPDFNASAVHRLRSAGAIILGKANLNELGWSLPAADDLVPPTRNPWNLDYASIGSSSGSGAAVAAGLCAAAIGTDGGGSVRLPAGQHGLVGIKPTHGRVSRSGMDASSISEISPLARTVADTATLLTVMAGHDVNDPQSWPTSPPSFADELDVDVRGIRVGVPWSYIESAGLEPEVAAAFEASLETLRDIGLELVDVAIPGLADARAANFIVLNSEAYADHATSLRQHPDRYGASALRYHWLGGFLSAGDYLNAKCVGRRVRQIVQDQFQDLRALVTPISPVVTAEAARQPGSHRKGINAAFTAPLNLTGHPAISIPAGLSPSTGLPIGLQLVAPLYDELTLFQLAHAYERATPWSTIRPSVDGKVQETSKS